MVIFIFISKLFIWQNNRKPYFFCNRIILIKLDHFVSQNDIYSQIHPYLIIFIYKLKKYYSN